jgi:predicted AAA+ superfamily ATPase
MYIIFKVMPYHRNIARAILKSPKYYFYDTGLVHDDSGAKLENLVACALLKEIHYREDCYGDEMQIYYLKNKDGKEIDFFITKESVPYILIEVKWEGEAKSSNFSVFEKYFKNISKIQVVKELKREKTYPDGTQIRKASQWLGTLDLSMK